MLKNLKNKIPQPPIQPIKLIDNLIINKILKLWDVKNQLHFQNAD